MLISFSFPLHKLCTALPTKNREQTLEEKKGWNYSLSNYANIKSWIQEPHCHLLSPAVDFGRGKGGEPSGSERENLTGPERASPLVRVFISFYVIDCLPQPIRQLLPVSKTSVQGGSRWVDMRKTFPNHLNPFWFSACYEDWTLELSTLHLKFGLLTKFSHHIPPMLRNSRYSNTENPRASFALNSPVSDLIVDLWTQHLVDY